MSNTYTQESIKTISFGRAIQEKIGMYLTADLDAALVLGLRELLYNSIDEYEQSFGDEIIITLNTKDHIITCADNARGIPVGTRSDGVNSLVAAFTMPHSGAKHDTEVYNTAVGINGIGAKVVCHTSEWMEVDVYRDNLKYHISFTHSPEGAIPSEITTIPMKGYSGTVVKYKPNPKIYGKSKIDINEIRKTLRELSYFTKGMKFTLIVDGKKEVFVSQNGLADALNTKDRVHKNILYYNKEHDDVKVELALQWCKEGSSLKSYANNLHVPDGGAFMTGFRSSLTRTFNNMMDTKYSGEIIRKYLDGYVSVKVKVPQFSNQAKTSLANPEARTAASSAVTEAFKDFYSRHRNDVEKILELMDMEQRAENAAKRAREAERQILQGQKKAKMITNLPAKLADAHGTGYKELYLVEGDSAGGTLKSVRNSETQAVLPLRGKVLNTYEKDLADIVENQEIKDMLLTFGAGAGQQVNLKGLRYDKIIIATDTDPDGWHISILLMGFFLKHLRPLVEKGHIYKVITPLYAVGTGRNKKFLYTDEELEAHIKKYGNPSHISRYKGLGSHNKEEIESFLTNPETRQLEPMTLDDMDATYRLYDAMMGNNLELRKILIRNGGLDE